VLKYIVRRILIGIVTVFGIVTVVFFLLRAIPGDPAEVWLGDYATPELVALTRSKWGLDKPLWHQYVIYMKHISNGDLGDSLRAKYPVAKLLTRHYPYTVRLCLLGVSLSVTATFFLIMTSKIEESENIRFFGAAYQSYMKQTKMFIPLLF